METVKAVKSFGGNQETRTFSKGVWDSGTPAKNGWRMLDHNTEVLARKLPEQAEIIAGQAKVTEVVVPPMPEPEPEGFDQIETGSNPEPEAPEKIVAETAPVSHETKVKAKPGRKPRN